MKWNREVDHALVSNVPEEEIRKIKKEYITDKVKDSIDFWGYRPEELADYIISAVLALKQLIQKLFYKLFETKPEQQSAPIDLPADQKQVNEVILETKQEKVAPVIREPEPIVMDFQTAEPVSPIIREPEPEVTAPDLLMTEPIDRKISEPEAQIPSRPEASAEAKAFSMLEKIKEELDKQNKIIVQAERKRNILEIERDDLRGLQVITKKVSLQRQIDSKEAQIDRLKAGLSKTVQRHGYRNVKDFYNAYYSAQKACADYIKKVKAWENTYGEEAKTKKQSIRERLDNYRKEVNERQAERIVYRSDRGAR
jgi:hypothetical protein